MCLEETHTFLLSLDIMCEGVMVDAVTAILES